MEPSNVTAMLVYRWTQEPWSLRRIDAEVEQYLEAVDMAADEARSELEDRYMRGEG